MWIIKLSLLPRKSLFLGTRKRIRKTLFEQTEKYFWDLERHIENTSKLRGDDLKFYIYHFYDNGNIKEIIPLQRRVVNFLGQKAERDESFCIDGYINKYDTQGGHIGAINYINGKKQEWFE